MNRFFLTLCGAVLLLCTTGSSAHAQRIDSPYRFLDRKHSLGLYGGYMNADAGVVDLGPRSAPAFGARYGLHISGAFDGELDLSLIPTTRFVTDTITVQGARRVLGEADATLLNVQAGLRFNLTGPRTFHGVQPYTVFGGGAIFDLAGRDALEEEIPEDVRYRFGTSFAGQLGAGADWYVAERLSLRLDARNVFWRLRTPQTFRTGEAGREIPEATWKRNVVFSAGVGLHF
jgi:hypothetical protein